MQNKEIDKLIQSMILELLWVRWWMTLKKTWRQSSTNLDKAWDPSSPQALIGQVYTFFVRLQLHEINGLSSQLIVPLTILNAYLAKRRQGIQFCRKVKVVCTQTLSPCDMYLSRTNILGAIWDHYGFEHICSWGLWALQALSFSLPDE